MGEVRSTNGREEELIYIIGRKAKGKTPLEDLNVGGWIILR
jgi:hypothetical protein